MYLVVYIATVYAYGYIISHLFVYFVYLQTYFSLYLCVYIYSERASYKNLTYLTYPSKNNNEWCQSNIPYTTHKHFHDQYRITCRISESYTLTEKAPQKNSLVLYVQYLEMLKYNTCIVKLQVNSVGLRYLGFFHYDRKVRA